MNFTRLLVGLPVSCCQEFQLVTPNGCVILYKVIFANLSYRPDCTGATFQRVNRDYVFEGHWHGCKEIDGYQILLLWPNVLLCIVGCCYFLTKEN